MFRFGRRYHRSVFDRTPFFPFATIGSLRKQEHRVALSSDDWTMDIEDQNRLDIVNEVKRHFPNHEVVDELEASSETLNVFVNRQNRRISTLSFTDLEWQDYHEHTSLVRPKIAKAAADALS